MSYKSRTSDTWIQTFTGRRFWPLDPSPDDVDILDIAHALSMTCRYNGHSRRFYSVAEHSVHVSRMVPAWHAMEGLLHDGAEAYLPDVPRPVKPHLPGFKDIEAGIDTVIAERFDLTFPWPEEVHVADATILADEQAALMSPQAAPWNLSYPAAGVAIECWSPEQAKWEFIKRFGEVKVGR